MNKKLHRVQVVLYVMAEDEFEACWAATNAPFDIFECVAAEAEGLDPGWEDAVPYNADDDRTCSEIFSDKEPARRPRAKPIKATVPCPLAENTATLRKIGIGLAQPELQS